jgi:D-arabinose 1-dehydrogenase-like Zn-dependent alcohol dehydrogenase
LHFIKKKKNTHVIIGEPLQRVQLELRQWDDDSVEIDVTHCGICGSDVHTLNESWGPTAFPCVVGHEIVGVVSRVGKHATNIRVGDRVGVGAQSGSCGECDECKRGMQNACRGASVYTYNSQWSNGDKSYGGYADKWRGDYRFVFKIPDNLSSEVAATFFCAGVTTFAPLKRTNVDSNSVVGVMGIGGLGHYGVLWAKAMGATVVGMSHNDKKKEVAFELGCDDYIVTSDEQQMEKYAGKMTHILCTGTSPDFQWLPYLNLLRANGHFINVNVPDWDLPPVHALSFVLRQIYIHGSIIGSPSEIEEMLEFAAENNVKPWITVYPMKEVQRALDDFNDGKPRFRFVLENC